MSKYSGLYITVMPKVSNGNVSFFYQIAMKNTDPRVNYGRDIIIHKGTAKTYKRASKNAWLFYRGIMASRELGDDTETTEDTEDTGDYMKRVGKTIAETVHNCTAGGITNGK